MGKPLPRLYNYRHQDTAEFIRQLTSESARKAHIFNTKQFTQTKCSRNKSEYLAAAGNTLSSAPVQPKRKWGQDERKRRIKAEHCREGDTFWEGSATVHQRKTTIFQIVFLEVNPQYGHIKLYLPSFFCKNPHLCLLIWRR